MVLIDVASLVSKIKIAKEFAKYIFFIFVVYVCVFITAFIAVKGLENKFNIIP